MARLALSVRISLEDSVRARVTLELGLRISARVARRHGTAYPGLGFRVTWAAMLHTARIGYLFDEAILSFLLVYVRVLCAFVCVSVTRSLLRFSGMGVEGSRRIELTA